jgi:hypothetical protein
MHTNLPFLAPNISPQSREAHNVYETEISTRANIHIMPEKKKKKKKTLGLFKPFLFLSQNKKHLRMLCGFRVIDAIKYVHLLDLLSALKIANTQTTFDLLR